MLSVLQQLDYNIVHTLVRFGVEHPLFAAFAYICAQLLIVLYVPLLAWLWYQEQPKAARHGNKKAVMLALMTLVLAVALKTIIALFYIRERPFVSHTDLQVVSLMLDPQSFPSGHTLVAAAVSFSLIMSGMRRLTPWLLILMALVGFGRIAMGVHYPSDVVGGLVFGCAAAWFLHRESSSIKRYLPDS